LRDLDQKVGNLVAIRQLPAHGLEALLELRQLLAVCVEVHRLSIFDDKLLAELLFCLTPAVEIVERFC